MNPALLQLTDHEKRVAAKLTKAQKRAVRKATTKAQRARLRRQLAEINHRVLSSELDRERARALLLGAQP